MASSTSNNIFFEYNEERKITFYLYVTKMIDFVSMIRSYKNEKKYTNKFMLTFKDDGNSI